MFNYRQQVVCIRQHKPLYRLEKMWTDRPIAIEDPFNLNHNLGSGISMRSIYSPPFRNSLSFANHQFFPSLFSGRLHPPRICHGSQILSNACQERAAQFRIARGWLVSVSRNLYLSSVYTRLLSLLTLIAMFFFQEYLFNPKVLIPNGRDNPNNTWTAFTRTFGLEI